MAEEEGPGRGAPTPVRRVRLADELAAQERLLRDGRVASRVGIVGEVALSYGVGVPPNAAYLARARAEGLAIAARSGGGTGVLHLPGDLLWAIVLPRSDPRVGRDFVRAYGRLGAGVVDALAREGVVAQWTRAPGTAESYCPLSSRGEVLLVGGRIVGGAAQHATADALLQHGMISSQIDRALVDRLFDLTPGGPSSALDGLGAVAERPSFADRFASALRDHLGP